MVKQIIFKLNCSDTRALRIRHIRTRFFAVSTNYARAGITYFAHLYRNLHKCKGIIKKNSYVHFLFQ